MEDETDLGNHKPAILEFYKYFENNYIGHKTETRVQVGPVKRGRRAAGYVPEYVMKDVMTEPIFPIRYWNVYTTNFANWLQKNLLL